MRANTCIVIVLLITPLVRSHAQGLWTQKAYFGGKAREVAIGFSIGGKGYIGTGLRHNTIGGIDFWEYDPATNIWTRKADVPGLPVLTSVGVQDLGRLGFPSATKDTSEPAVMTLPGIRISGNMTPLPMYGRRKLISEERR